MFNKQSWSYFPNEIKSRISTWDNLPVSSNIMAQDWRNYMYIIDIQALCSNKNAWVHDHVSLVL